jgi:nicotinamide-nucleotide amidase
VVVVTGSELVRGERTDRNGPFLAAEALRLGLEPARITIVGDRVDELEDALAEGLRSEVCLISGGLGPTHDDRTVALLARAAGLELVVDEELEREIESVSRRVAERLRRPYGDFAEGVRKQATRPVGAASIGLAGTAPGLVLEVGGCVVVVLPGPPPELQRLWRSAVESEPLRRVLRRTQPPERRVLRFYGASESAVAQALAAAGGDGDGVEATICARQFEIHVDLLFDSGRESRAERIASALRTDLSRHLFAEDERPVEELVLGLCRARGLTLATAESCTGGLVAAKLTSVAGSSDVFVGSVVAYADGVKERELAVPRDRIERHGSVSPEVAEAMASGVRARLGADVAVAVTGVAGPGGGTPDKPVGLVFLHAEAPDGGRGLRFDFPGDREAIRTRSAVGALHLVRRVLSQSPDERV